MVYLPFDCNLLGDHVIYLCVEVVAAYLVIQLMFWGCDSSIILRYFMYTSSCMRVTGGV